MVKIKALIVDDERKSRELLAHLVNKVDNDIEIVGMSGSVDEAEEEILKLSPNLVFMDIDMPKRSGLSLFESDKIEINFQVVFVTAYSEYALHAFKVNALDYILKPVSIDDLKNVISKVRSKLNSSNSDFKSLQQQILRFTESPKIGLPTTTGINFVEISKIMRCEASSNYTIIHMVNNEKIIVSRTLRDLEEILEPYLFYRVHKSHLVKLSHIVSYRKGEHSSLTLSNGVVIPVSKPMRSNLEQHLDIL